MRQRFQQIYQTFKRDPGANLANMRYSEDAGIAKKRQDQIFEKLSSCYADWRASGAPPAATGRFANNGHIQLKDGEVIRSRDLCSFIRHIQSFLPPPEPPKPLAPLLRRALRTLPDREDELYSRPVVPGVRNMAGRPAAKAPRKRRQPRAPGSYVPRPPRRKRRREGPRVTYHGMASVDREIERFLRPVWLTRARPGRYSEEELATVSRAAHTLGRALAVPTIPAVLEEEVEAMEPREVQLVEAVRARQGEVVEELEAPVVAAPRPAVQRTYSRRPRGGVAAAVVKQSTSRTQTPVAPAGPSATQDVLTLLPPSRAALLGVRGLQIRGADLRTKAKGRGGAQAGGEGEGASGGLTPAEAEARLVRRVAQMFFWPTKMCDTPPPKQENLFDYSDDEKEEVEEDEEEEIEMDNIVISVGKVARVEEAVEEVEEEEAVVEPSTSKEPVVVRGRGLHGLMRSRLAAPDTPEL